MKKNKEKNLISIVIYIYNNNDDIENFFDKISQSFSNEFEKVEYICVNDFSNDSSLKTLNIISKKYDNCTFNIINMSYHQGLEKSMNAGTDLSIGDFIIEIDNISTNFDIENLMKLYKECLKGYDVVTLIPSKTKMLSKMFYHIFNKYSKLHNKIGTETARIISRRGINRIGMLYSVIPYRKVAYLNCGLKTSCIKYDTINNKKQNEKDKRSIAINSLMLFTNVAYKFSMFMSFIMVIFTIAMSIYTAVVYFGNFKPIEGWTTLMLFLSFAFLGVFIFSTIIIKYLALLLEMSFNKNKYMIESIEKVCKD